MLLTPRRMSASPSVCLRPPCRLPCGLIEWRWGCAVMPVFGLGLAPCIVLLPLVLSSPPSLFVFAVTACWLGCVIVTGLCHWGIAVMVCVGRKGVWCLLSTVYTSSCVVCVSVVCVITVRVLSCRIVLWVVEWWWCEECVVSSFVFFLSVFFFLFVLVFGVVRAQPCEHARYPEHHCVSLVVCFACLVFSRPAFLLLEWRWVIYHVSVCCVGMTATGSLSRSSSFFW